MSRHVPCFHELETFTVTVLQGEDLHLSAGELAVCPDKTLAKGGRGVSAGVLYCLVCMSICAQVYTNLPIILSCGSQGLYCSTLGANLLYECQWPPGMDSCGPWHCCCSMQ